MKMYTKYKIVKFCPYHFVRPILSNTILSAYPFVHTILSVPFCPLPFCPVTLGALETSGACGLCSLVIWMLRQSAWYGYTLANDRARIERLPSRLVRMDYLTKDSPNFLELVYYYGYSLPSPTYSITRPC